MRAVFEGGRLDGHVSYLIDETTVEFFPDYFLARIERTAGPDGIDSETAIYEFRWPDRNPSQSL